jgi:hypothetical protein
MLACLHQSVFDTAVSARLCSMAVLLLHGWGSMTVPASVDMRLIIGLSRCHGSEQPPELNLPPVAPTVHEQMQDAASAAPNRVLGSLSFP